MGPESLHGGGGIYFCTLQLGWIQVKMCGTVCGCVGVWVCGCVGVGAWVCGCVGPWGQDPP